MLFLPLGFLFIFLNLLLLVVLMESIPAGSHPHDCCDLLFYLVPVCVLRMLLCLMLLIQSKSTCGEGSRFAQVFPVLMLLLLLLVVNVTLLGLLRGVATTGAISCIISVTASAGAISYVLRVTTIFAKSSIIGLATSSSRTGAIFVTAYRTKTVAGGAIICLLAVDIHSPCRVIDLIETLLLLLLLVAVAEVVVVLLVRHWIKDQMLVLDKKTFRWSTNGQQT
ncbi:uncharacterized protein LOC110021757, partial [Phalaenopsis equestris]|uniref:uncharacterized protein LOC110021757 n=1 Tax=Phalaenopsis equestris TaxID=78828 RepID=UPI0009E6367C